MVFCQGGGLRSHPMKKGLNKIRGVNIFEIAAVALLLRNDNLIDFSVTQVMKENRDCRVAALGAMTGGSWSGFNRALALKIN